MELVPQPILKDVHPELFEILENLQFLGSNVCGGYARWLASSHNAKAGDIDVYPIDDQAMDESLIFLDDIGIKKHRRKVGGNYPNVDEVHTFKVKTSWRTWRSYTIQLIKPDDFSKHILNTFDFTIVQAMLDTVSKQVLTVPEWRTHEMDKVLILRNPNYSSSGAASFRLTKYMKKGYSISDINLFEMYISFKTHIDRSYFFEEVKALVYEMFKCEIKEKYPTFVNFVNLHKLDPKPQPSNDIPF